MSSSRARTSASKKLNPLDKRIPENPRYAHIKPTVDTGASISKYLRHLEDIRQNYRYRKDEIFRRLKATTFAQLVLQVESLQVEGDEAEEEKENSFNGIHSPPYAEDQDSSYDGMTLPEGNDMSPPNSARSTLSSVIAGVGELDMKERSLTSADMATQRSALAVVPCPYLLLDVRDSDSYDHSHIITAKSYPATMLSRSCNYFTKDILEFKNKPGKIIILYDEDERIAPTAATTFIQRDVDNIFMLSGGMKVLNRTFPGCMITGAIPASCVPTPPNSSRSTARRSGHGLSSKSLERGMAKFSPTSPLPMATEHKGRFTEEDLDKLQSCLDNALMSGSTSSSRASSRATSTGAISHRSATSSTSRTCSSTTPWK